MTTLVSGEVIGISGITIDSTSITGGTATRLLFENGSNQISEDAGLTYVAATDTLTTGACVISNNGTASTPTLSLTGTIYTAGSATTSKALLLIESSGATSTGWMAKGTALGINSAAVGVFLGQLLDIQMNGASKMAFGDHDGTGNQPSLMFHGNTGITATCELRPGSGLTIYVTGGDFSAHFASAGAYLQTKTAFTIGVNPTSPDVFLTRTAAATLQFGAADAAAPVAQTTQVQSVVAGTSNTAGADWTLLGSKSTGTGTPGDIIFQTSAKGAAATSVNAANTAMTLKGGTGVGLSGSVVLGSAAISSSATDGFLYIPTCAGTATGTPTAFTGRVALIYDITNNKFSVYNGAWKQVLLA